MKQFDNNNLLNYFSLDELETIYNIENLYLKALIIIHELYKDNLDKEGKPYIGHLIRVAAKLEEMTEKIAGLLHDTVEDTDITFDDLVEIGFPKEIVEIVKLVTNEDIDSSTLTRDEKLELYYKKIDSIINSNNIHAIRLKESDMSDNYNPSRIYYLPEETQEWARDKYSKPLQRLRRKLKEIDNK